MIKIAQLPPVSSSLLVPGAAPTTSHTMRAAHISSVNTRRLAALIGRSATHPKQAAAAQSGADKITRFVSLLAGGDNLLSGIARLMAEKSKGSDQDMTRCESEVQSAFAKKRTQTLSQLKQMEKKASEQKKLGFWDKLLNVVKSVVEAIAAIGVVGVGVAGGLAAGIVGVISALATGASIVVSHTVKSADGMWAGLGLSLGGGLLGGLTSALAGDGSTKGAATGLKQAFEKARGVVTGGVEVARDVNHSQLKAAEAELGRSETNVQRTTDGIEDHIAQMKNLVRSLEAFTDLVKNALGKDDAATAAAVGR